MSINRGYEKGDNRMNTDTQYKLIADLQRISEMVHENSDAVKWAMGMMKIVMQEYDDYQQQLYISRNAS